ncbi:hypothetical protein HNR46_002906 [Haloferula luteola]|uniref:Uncharacterized protein n=1 Tax=Haloferula luteola TaxID=595692 RepID=A0A840VDE9_9BACT|nr:hypothetical protein [Haloferula luteola]MBB5352658.1 hypothetical protein [Haloferula luteola]
MIALIGNRPVIQVGRHQVHDYDTGWLGDALRRAARAAEREDFPCLDDIQRGIEEYLESRCSLQLLPLHELFDRLRRMLETIGCRPIAEKLEPLAPPITLCLETLALEVGQAFELGFFSRLREELGELRRAGAEEVRFIRLRESVLKLRSVEEWDAECDALVHEVRDFLRLQDKELRGNRPFAFRVEGERFE